MKTAEDAAKKSYEFWSTQPVPKLDETITSNEAIAQDVPLEKLRKDPYSLPGGFQWDTLNLEDPLVVSRSVFLIKIVLFQKLGKIVELGILSLNNHLTNNIQITISNFSKSF